MNFLGFLILIGLAQVISAPAFAKENTKENSKENSKETKSEEEEFELSVIERLSARETEILEQALRAKKNRFNALEAQAYQVQFADIVNSPTYLGHILKGSLLVELATDEQVLLNKDIHVRAYIQPDKAGYIYLKDSTSPARYKTLASNVSRITEVTRMQEPPDYYRPIAKVKTGGALDRGSLKNEIQRDKDLSFDSELNFYLGLTNPNFTRDLVNDDTSNPGFETKYELQTFSSFSLPFKLGGSLIFEHVRGDLGGGEEYTSSSLSLGPVIKSPEFTIGKGRYVASAGARTSIFSNIQEQRLSEKADYRLSQTSLFASLQKRLDLYLGTFLLGVNLQRKWSKASSDGFQSDISFNSVYDDSISMFFGFALGEDSPKESH